MLCILKGKCPKSEYSSYYCPVLCCNALIALLLLSVQKYDDMSRVSLFQRAVHHHRIFLSSRRINSGPAAVIKFLLLTTFVLILLVNILSISMKNVSYYIDQQLVNPQLINDSIITRRIGLTKYQHQISSHLCTLGKIISFFFIFSFHFQLNN